VGDQRFDGRGHFFAAAAAVDRLIDLYTATNQPAEAAQWQAERAKYAAPATSPGEKK
jgi:hypothetical protein